MSEILEQILALAVKGIGGLVAIWVAKKLGSVINSMESKYKIDLDNEVEGRLILIARRTVRALFQCEVQGLKKLGKFDGDAQKAVMIKAIGSIKEELKGSLMKKEDKELKKIVESVIAEEKKY